MIEYYLPESFHYIQTVNLENSYTFLFMRDCNKIK